MKPLLRPALLLAFLLSAPVSAQCEDAKILLPDGGAGDGFGARMAMDGDFVIVGASGDNEQGTNSGAAWILRLEAGAWIPEQKLLAPGGSAQDIFGESVDIDGAVAIVGAPQAEVQGETFAGTATLFRRSGAAWVVDGAIKALDPTEFAGFGSSVAVSGSVAIVGASGDGPQSSTGAAYIFRFDGDRWLQEAKLFASDPAPQGFFGWSVDIDGTQAIIGANGKVYVFHHHGAAWGQEARIPATGSLASVSFGVSVALDDPVALVGATGVDSAAGAVHVYRRHGSAWPQEAVVQPPDVRFGDIFGIALQASGDSFIAGSRRDDDVGTSSGSAHVFRLVESGWVHARKLIGSDGGGDDELGLGVVLSGRAALAGAPGHDATATNAGAVYAFDANLTGDDCNGNGLLDACEFLAGIAADCNENGHPDDCDILEGTDADCNDNGVPDQCDIGGGASSDCNENGLPDDCEADCNYNGVADECDIADGTSRDCDGNGIPDECDGFECPFDLDGNCAIDFGDLLMILSNWGPCPGG